MYMYVLILKNYIRYWRIHTYGLKNTILDTYVCNTYDLKNTTCWWGWMVADERRWMDVCGRMSVDGRNRTNRTERTDGIKRTKLNGRNRVNGIRRTKSDGRNQMDEQNQTNEIGWMVIDGCWMKVNGCRMKLWWTVMVMMTTL